MPIEIRPCRPDDAAALSLVGQATTLETYPEILPLADMLAHAEHEHGRARYAGWLADPAYRIWIAELEATRSPVGYLVLCPPDLPVPTGPGDLEVRRIYVLGPYKGAGLGARLMATAFDAARAAGARRLFLGVNGANRAAQAFYARQGFVQAGVRRFKVGASTHDDLVLARTLSATASSSASRCPS
jgi:ribosomal protein S18 acetylase RimI-like enzyme